MNSLVRRFPTVKTWLRRAFSAFKLFFHTARGFFPFTWISIVLAVLIYFIWYWEVSAHANQILYAAVIMWGFAWAVLVLFTLISTALVFFVTRHRNKKCVLECKNEVGGHIDSAYCVFTPFFMPFVSIDTELITDSFIRHPHRQYLWESEWLEPSGRGKYSSLSRRITVSDIFGMTSMSFVLKQPAAMEILPSSKSYEMRAFQTKTTGDGYSHPEGDPNGELIEMRRYQAGDPLRLVLWKVFARSRKLVVRAPEPAIVDENDMFVYFVSGVDDEASAAVARAFLAGFESDSGNLCFAADGAHRIAQDKTQGLNDIVDSAAHKEHSGEDLLTVAPLISPAMMKQCFLLVPQKSGSWIQIIQKFIAQYDVHPVFILSVDGDIQTKSSKSGSLLGRIFKSTDKNSSQSSDVDEICKALSPMGIVRIVDISTGASRDYQQATVKS